MTDFYTLLAYIQNDKRDGDILGQIDNILKTPEQIKTNEITDMIITDDVDEFAEGKNEENVVENFKEPKKNKRRIHIPDAEIKKFHNRFYEDSEEYYEPRKDQRYSHTTQSEDEEYPNTTPTKNRRQPNRRQDKPKQTQSKPSNIKKNVKKNIQTTNRK